MQRIEAFEAQYIGGSATRALVVIAGDLTAGDHEGGPAHLAHDGLAHRTIDQIEIDVRAGRHERG